MPDKRVPAAVEEMKAGLAALSGAEGLETALTEAGRLLETLADRLARPEGPLVVAVCGPTGAGKSHLVNFLAGGPVSPSGYRRPSTVAPVVTAPAGALAAVADPGFLPGYRKTAAAGSVVFDGDPADSPPPLYILPPPAPPWNWPDDLVLIDTPDFDSVRLENQAQALDMARRADAVIMVTHQAKYADQSTWDFLKDEAERERPLLIILNRVTAAAAADDFQRRLDQAGLQAPLLLWPEETAVGQINIQVARRSLTDWLEELGRRGRELAAASGRRAMRDLGRLLRGNISVPLENRLEELDRGLAAVRRVSEAWQDRPLDRVSLNLPLETRAELLKNLGELVRRSDWWAKPRRIIGRPLALVGEGFRKLLGRDAAVAGADRPPLADHLLESSREALVAAVRAEARELAAAAALPSPQPALDLSPEEIRERHAALSARLDEWLKKETEALLSGLPLGQKAAFYLVQLLHVALVGGLWLQAGGLPGTEVLLGGALGPVISQLTGAVISRESLSAFEARAAERHQRELSDIFQAQSRRYEDCLAAERRLWAAGRSLPPTLELLEKEAARLWG